MPSCYLFINYLNDEGCLSLKLNDDGSCAAPVMQRTFQDIISLQTEAKTIIIVGTEHASILEVELPWLGENKARAAIPFALEDNLTQPVDRLHFAFDRQHYQNQKYLVAVIDKQEIGQLIELLKNKQIHFDCITLDWFALNENELCLMDDKLLIHHSDFKGAMSLELADLYLKNPKEGRNYLFNDSKAKIKHIEFEKIDDQSANWLAKRLHNKNPLNLCQGEFQQHEQDNEFIKKGYRLVGLLAVVWLILMIVSDISNIHYLNKTVTGIDNKIAVIYKEFFPDAKQVISPKFRVSQLLGTSSDSSKATFWQLIGNLSKAIKSSNARIEQLSYQNNRISITLACPDFSSLEQVENRLKKLHLKINRTQAASRDKQVIATLELM